MFHCVFQYTLSCKIFSRFGGQVLMSIDILFYSCVHQDVKWSVTMVRHGEALLLVEENMAVSKSTSIWESQRNQGLAEEHLANLQQTAASCQGSSIFLPPFACLCLHCACAKSLQLGSGYCLPHMSGWWARVTKLETWVIRTFHEDERY